MIPKQKFVGLLILGYYVQIAVALHPIVYAPGLGDNRLEARLNKPIDDNEKCQTKSDNFTIWLNFSSFHPSKFECLVQDLRMNYNELTGRTEDLKGVDITVPGFGDTDTIKYPSTNIFYNTISSNSRFIRHLETHGFKSGVSLRGAPYDFRRSPHEQQEYFMKLKVLIEETYEANNNTKVLLVGHSYGGFLLWNFLADQPQEWKSKYIQSFVSLAVPYGGTITSLRAFVTGISFGIPNVQPEKMREMERSFSSIAALLPSQNSDGENKTLVESECDSYTADDYERLFEDMGFEAGFTMWEDSQVTLTSPGVQVHCLHGVGVQTIEKLTVDDIANPKHSTLGRGDGDGIVERRSLEACKQITDAHSANCKKDVYKKFNGVKHLDILTNEEVLKHIIALANQA